MDLTRPIFITSRNRFTLVGLQKRNRNLAPVIKTRDEVVSVTLRDDGAVARAHARRHIVRAERSANNESSEVCGIIKPGRRVKLK